MFELRRSRSRQGGGGWLVTDSFAPENSLREGEGVGQTYAPLDMLKRAIDVAARPLLPGIYKLRCTTGLKFEPLAAFGGAPAALRIMEVIHSPGINDCAERLESPAALHCSNSYR